MAEREGAGMMRKFPQIDLMCGPGELDKLPMLIDNALKTSAAEVADRAQVVALQGNNHRRTSTLILVSGPIASHGMAIMSAREGLGFESPIESDTAYLGPLVELLQQAAGAEVHVLRDPTRGGVASVLNEIAAASGMGMELDDQMIPVPGPVRAACDLLGLDPLYVANEGVLVALVGSPAAADALAALRSHPLGREASVIGPVTSAHAGLVVLETGIGGRRVVDLLPGDQLPRIC
jgi:hydrogenase expression/formation protein HypE